jgi:hypothetical protein
VQSVRIVEAFDVVEDSEASLRMIGERLPLDEFTFERGKEALAPRKVRLARYQDENRRALREPPPD